VAIHAENLQRMKLGGAVVVLVIAFKGTSGNHNLMHSKTK
jgi:hypothetical protein